MSNQKTIGTQQLTMSHDVQALSPKFDAPSTEDDAAREHTARASQTGDGQILQF